ncbi:MAG: endonuclease VIII [Gammaproteobacteria bacterium]|nr:endonuclease VIII [Gammaproteobacteria bacterium]MDH3411348.1 endonuclease VIII [Gammaproteobacteria bacterium]
MPEGPEIRIEAERVRAAIEGYKARTVFFGLKALKKYEKFLAGQKVVSVRARGKAMLIGFGNGMTLYSHNQLYGRWVVCDNGHVPESGRQLRVAIDGTKKRALLYSASDIAVLPSENIDEHPYLRGLGPDILNARVAVKQIKARFELEKFRRRSIASLFLDKNFLAGVGNYLRSEILFASGVHPSRRPEALSGSELSALARETRRIMLRSYRTRGVTNDPDRVRELKSKGWSRGQYRFAVFGRGGESCFDCGDTIVRQSLSGRRCYFCPTCQPL